LRPACGTAAVPELEFPVPTTVPALGYSDVTVEVATGFVVVHDTLILQVLPPDAITHADGESVSAPLIAAG